MKNIDQNTVTGFGKEWQQFDHADASEAEVLRQWEEYFHIFPKELLSSDATGADFGCGSGRFAQILAGRVGRLYCVDASRDALKVAETNLRGSANVTFLNESLSEMSIPADSLDFGYSLGVLHHLPDTQDALNQCVARLKSGAPFLLYLYYAFDNRSRGFRLLWKVSDRVRRIISRLPFRGRYWATQAIAAVVYWPLARVASLLEKLGADVRQMPLSYYRDREFYVLRNDALDRFGTRLEKRFSRAAIAKMMNSAGLTNIRFSETPPFWTAIGFRLRS